MASNLQMAPDECAALPRGADAGAGLFLAAIGLRFPHPEREAEEVRAASEPPPHFEELLRPDS